MNYTEQIRSLREDNDLNQTAIARIINVAQTTYSDYEDGKVRIPIECLICLAKFYDVDMNYITGISRKKALSHRIATFYYIYERPPSPDAIQGTRSSILYFNLLTQVRIS